MRRIMLSAMMSGSGKTVMTTAILLALKRRGQSLISFKCGPDYIDPMYHTRVLGIPCRNLDLFLMGSRAVAEELSVDGDYEFAAAGELSANGDYDPAEVEEPTAKRAHNTTAGSGVQANGPYDLAVIEGAMGFYDGIGGTTRASAYEIASQTNTPVLLVIRSKGQSTTLAAQLCGMLKFRENPCLAGVIFTECTERLYAHLKPIVERETGLSVFGYLPKMEEAVIDSRHLGLVTAEEIEDFGSRFSKVADQLEKTVDLDGILRMAEQFQTVPSGGDMASERFQAEEQFQVSSADESAIPEKSQAEESSQAATIEPLRKAVTDPVWRAAMGITQTDAPDSAQKADVDCAQKADVDSAQITAADSVRIAIARDEAFCFYYESSFEALRREGAELVWFSPVRGEHFPENIHGLYLGGGYPERYAAALSKNENILAAIRSARSDGMPIVAECGGFLYLLEKLEGEDGNVYPMAGVLPGNGFRTKGLRRFGYAVLQADTDSLLFRAGENVPAHSFHHWDASDPGSGLFVRKAADLIQSGKSSDGGKSGSTGDLTGEETSPVSGWRECFADENLYAGFPHLALGGELPLAEKFVERCRSYRDKMVR